MEDRRISKVRVTVALVILGGAAYLAVARWKALNPGQYAPRVTGPRFDLTWWK
jgi:hypothetical protein